MTQFLEYWTTGDYVLLAVLLIGAGICTFMAIRAERQVKRASRQVRMTAAELAEHNAAMQQALKQWELCEACADALERQYG